MSCELEKLQSDILKPQVILPGSLRTVLPNSCVARAHSRKNSNGFFALTGKFLRLLPVSIILYGLYTENIDIKRLENRQKS